MKQVAAAVFLDRDGVLIEDRGLLLDRAEVRILAGVAAALQRLQEAGFRLIVVTNQAVVARGLITERDVELIHREMSRQLEQAGAPPLDAIYFCPHHPEATLPEYRLPCECRKPRAGALLRAAAEFGLDLRASFMVGDRLSDVAAGVRAGCRTVLLQSGQHEAPPIVSVEPLEASLRPDYTCSDLAAAAAWIVGQR